MPTNLYSKLQKLATEVPSTRKHLVPLLKKHAPGKAAGVGGIDSRSGWDEILVGDKVRIRWKGHPQSYAVIEELPQKGRKRLKRYTFDIGSKLNPIHSNHLMLENLKRDWKPTASMTPEKASQALRKAIDKAFKDWEKDIAAGKGDIIPDWFRHSFDERQMPRVDEVFYLNVEPVDYAPIEIAVKDEFFIDAKWTGFSITLNNGYTDEQLRGYGHSGDSYYTKLVSTAPAGARKFFKWLKANEEAVKKMKSGALEEALKRGKIRTKYQSSVWR